MIQYEKEMLARGVDFRARLMAEDPDHQDLRLIDADIAARQARIATLTGASPEPKPKEALQALIAEYKRGVRTPDLFTAYYRTELEMEVPACNWTEAEIRRPMVEINGQKNEGIMVPSFPNLNLLFLAQKFPDIDSRIIRAQGIFSDSHDTVGWVKTYRFIDSPNRNTTRSEIEAFAKRRGYLGGRGKIYVLSGQAQKGFTGHYPGEGTTITTITGCLGSRLGGEVLRLYFYRDGELGADEDLAPEVPDGRCGWLLEEVKKT